MFYNRLFSGRKSSFRHSCLPRLHTPTSFDAHISDLIMALAIPAIAFILLILGAYAWAAWNPVSRPHLQPRQLPASCLCSDREPGLRSRNDQRYQTESWFRVQWEYIFYDSCLMFAGIYVLLHGAQSPVWTLCIEEIISNQLMEIGSGARRKWNKDGKMVHFRSNTADLGPECAPYAAGALGYWDLNETCWYNSPDPKVQLAWVVGTQSFWLLLMSTCEVIIFLSIVLSPRVRAVISGTVMASPPLPPNVNPPVVLNRTMILRIGLYPLFSCFLNVTGAALDIHAVLDTVYTEVNWRLGIVDLLIYDLRPLMYATLAATDPSFLRALRALRHPELEAQFITLQSKATTNIFGGVTSVGQVSQNGDTGTATKTDAESALSESLNVGSGPELTRQL
ncbi:hypothetical protein MSAN_01553200 [Mycena sanguinolenta]|uniref:Uncharacterized protein n=1 Tax=Mycena sanguinolenta TaxID=230812 RepID=A0A8H7CX48_9AGAR|nr:hypothetical protein MSAN_01553200 [Mycena sanguinolenta]